MGRKIYVVISRSNDECSCGNRAFYSYEAAYAYLLSYEKESGCEMAVIAMEIE